MIIIGMIELFLLVWIISDVKTIKQKKENQNTMFILYLKAGLLGVTIATQSIITYLLNH